MTDLSANSLERIVRHHCPNTEGDLRFEPITTGKFNTSFFVHANGQELVLRIAPRQDAIFVFYERGMMRQEPGIHERLLSHTSVPVAPIIAYGNSHELIDRDFLIMDRLPGDPLTEMHHVPYDHVLRQVGEHLAATHALTAKQYGYLGEHAPMRPQDTWVAAFEIMWNKMIDDIIDVGHYDRGEAKLMRGLLDGWLPLFDRDVPSSLLHMDIWHQNILVDGDGRVAGIVDWDRALWGDPEIEFAVLDYCGISEPAFWEGYGRERDTSPDARVRQVFYLLYELQKYIVIRQGRGNDPVAANRYKQQVMGIAGQLRGG